MIRSWLVGLCMMLWLSGCGNTLQGMREDINHDTSPDTHTTVVKRTTVVNTTDQGPDSPPPMETPPQ